MSDIRIGFSREMARSVLKRYEVSIPPVSPENIASAEGLEVRVINTWPSRIDGLLLRESRLVGVNGNHSRLRRRFSLAHELGHWFLRHESSLDENEVTIDNPPAEDGDRYRAQEGEANEFAGELLAPLHMLKDALKKTKDAEALGKLFDISVDALWVRIVRHNLLK